jgi:hypothetical protein
VTKRTSTAAGACHEGDCIVVRINANPTKRASGCDASGAVRQRLDSPRSDGDEELVDAVRARASLEVQRAAVGGHPSDVL